MSGHQVMRAMLAVERAHPRRIARNADEWMRCAQILEAAANQIDFIAARQSEIGGQTGPSMGRAMAQASEVLRVKARDLRRGGDALSYIADATHAHQEEKRRIDREHPDDGAVQAVFLEEGSRKVADGQESALRHGIQVMKSIEVGEDPSRTPIYVSTPHPIYVPPPTWVPPKHEVRPPPPLDPTIDPDEGYDDQAATPQGPLGAPSGPGAPVSPGALSGPGAPSGINPAALVGGAVLGTAGAVAGGRAIAGPGAPGGSGARGIGAGGSAGSGGVLGRSGKGATGGAGGRGGSAGGVGTGGRGGRRTKDEREHGDRDLHDDGKDWLDDDAGPGVLR